MKAESCEKSLWRLPLRLRGGRVGYSVALVAALRHEISALPSRGGPGASGPDLELVYLLPFCIPGTARVPIASKRAV